MKYGPCNFKDKSGREVIIRNAELTDSEDLLKYLTAVAAETPYLIREPDEITTTLEEEKEFLQSKLENPKEVILIAIVNGEHVGNCSLSCAGNFRRYSHRCVLAIALYQKYCGSGIGRKMLETVLEIAKNLGFEQAELEVIADNHKAISLYEKVGFVKCGCFPDSVKYSDGSYADAFVMTKRL